MIVYVACAHLELLPWCVWGWHHISSSAVGWQCWKHLVPTSPGAHWGFVTWPALSLLSLPKLLALCQSPALHSVGMMGTADPTMASPASAELWERKFWEQVALDKSQKGKQPSLSASEGKFQSTFTSQKVWRWMEALFFHTAVLGFSI